MEWQIVQTRHSRTHARTHVHTNPPIHPHTYTHGHTHTHTHTHTPKSVQRNDKYKILWNFNIHTDRVIEYRLPDIVCINKQNKASDYWLCFPCWPKHSHQKTGKNWQESLECQTEFWKVVVIRVVNGTLGKNGWCWREYIRI